MKKRTNHVGVGRENNFIGMKRRGSLFTIALLFLLRQVRQNQPTGTSISKRFPFKIKNQKLHERTNVLDVKEDAFMGEEEEEEKTQRCRN